LIAPHELEFPPLLCSREGTLGDYYQDFSAAIDLVEGGYHGGMDADGVPLLSLGPHEQVANAVTTAQYALANLIAVGRGERQRERIAKVQLDWLVQEQELTGRWSGCWLMRHDNPKYRWLRAPWTGALALAHPISALLRGWEMFGVPQYREAAEFAYLALHAEGAERGLIRATDDVLWYEEYPADPPLHVLNGHIYTLLATLDYARITGDSEAERRWRQAAMTALAHLRSYDLGYWSLYDLRWREPASLHYHKNIHIPQLRILAALTGEHGFTASANAWSAYLDSRVSRARLAVALRLQRFKRQ
jgi:hypothetical protein